MRRSSTSTRSRHFDRAVDFLKCHHTDKVDSVSKPVVDAQVQVLRMLQPGNHCLSAHAGIRLIRANACSNLESLRSLADQSH